MKTLFALLLIISACTLSHKAVAQATLQEGKEGEILQAPKCSKLVNRSDQTIMGTLSTAGQTIASGDMVRHRNNFTLQAGQELEFCVAGPFFEGRRVEIILRTIIPLFDCKTKLDSPVYLDATPDENGFKKLSATCS